MDEITGPIAAYAASLTFDDLPAAVVERATTLVIDTLACALGAFTSPQATIARKLAQGEAPLHYPGRLLGTHSFAAADLATFANAAAVRYLDFNDTYPGGHPSDCLGALLALTEAAGADGRRFLTSLIVAYETFARLIGGTGVSKGWSQSMATAVATVAGLGSLLRLPPEAIGHALGIAATSNVSLGVATSGEISQWKGAASPFAARNAVFAVLMAAEGTTGPDAPFAGRRGVWEQVSGHFALAPFGARGGAFLLPLVRTKYWPVQYETQAAVWAALELRERVPEAAIESIQITTYGRGWQEQGPEKWDPRTRETADHSLPYVFARALRDGTIDLCSFDEAAVRDPALRPLMAKVQVQQGTGVDARAASRAEVQLVATTLSGERHEVREFDPLGHERNPMGAEQVSAKFRRLATPLLTADGAEAALQVCWRLEGAASLAPLLNTLVVPTA